MNILKVAAALFSALLGVSRVIPQSHLSQTAPAMTGQAETASVYVTAVTNKGKLIPNLKPEDIAIVEDKLLARIEKVSCGKPETVLVGTLIDVSGSRRSDSRLKSHYDDLEVFLNHLLTTDDGAYVVAFNDSIYKLSQVISDRTQLNEAFEKLRRLQPHSSTALYDTVKAAAGADFKGRSGHRILVVVGDWEDNSSRITIDEAVKAAQRTFTTIYAVVDSDSGMVDKKFHKRAVARAKEFTEETGGLAYIVEEKNDFARALQAIDSDIAGACKVDYTPSSKSPDAQQGTKIHVEATSKDISIYYPRVRFGIDQ